MEFRNIAIIAHVNHGKTSLTDAILKQTGMVNADFSMNINTLEKEKGITIYAKNASFDYKGVKVNIVDTPGHADFGSEVERVLRSIDSVVLLVDADEGPMPQTKFVLKKSLELGLKPILVINKMDKASARPEWVLEQVYSLFIDLGANDIQLEFPIVYAIAREGKTKINLADEYGNLDPLLDLILKHVKPAPSQPELPLRFQSFNLAYDNFLGRMAVGRIYEGTIKDGDVLIAKKPDGTVINGKITKIFAFRGMERVPIASAIAGDIVMIAGFPDIYIGDTVCVSKDQEAMPAISIEEPTISMEFLVNNSPFAGREGKYVTSRQIRERLEKELEVNVGLRVDFSSMDYLKVYGRGELHLGILIENMRREGFELQVSQPEVIFKTINGEKCEPIEELIIDTPENFSGVIIEKLGKRRGLMVNLETRGKMSRMVFEIPTRGLLGYKSEFLLDTRGEGIISSRFKEYQPHKGDIQKRSVGSMISGNTGKAMAYSMNTIQQRGALYIPENTEVYEGMVIGNTSKGDQLVVNPTKAKHQTNIRAAGSDENILLAPPLILEIETGMEIMGDDEYLEITPLNIRLRKKGLTEIDRKKSKR
ncbi:MAG: GTP-binding protein TypA/BipA [Parcubacteria group bacterium Gr01-1014_18]|nr:MAG: GTP-binding protein TypA/BipA [Parcubacteria group bacterium Greene0416_36]TSC81439.1 MAG: GTP-binding protein TypA/BipA [Parcubacteria group bacterium Gr01-1014_18]TSC99037.1 MAG: GTP-binding protein TypA/BipA [Parcubacteria group bacterium Greene1014_20]TSD07282.1 MAG: GTP-binding protein TypA/BipA [Parcubacteria group bacterium Greene0714_2]